MKKKLLCLLLAMAMLFLSGCHGSQKSSAFMIPETFDEDTSVEITFWAKNDTNKAQTDIYQRAIRDFELLYPNIHVNIRLYTDYGRIYNDVITNIATSTTPNVCITYPDHIATYLTGRNTVVPLDELISDERYGLGGNKVRFASPSPEKIVPEYLEECKIGDHYYALPYMRSTEACYVNKTYVEALGYTLPEILTWDFVWQVSEAAMKTDENGNFSINGQKVMIPFIYKSTDNMMIQILHQLNAGYSDAAGNIDIFNDTTALVMETVYEHAKSKAFSTFKISSYPANFLNAGQCIFAIDSTAGATWMGSKAPLSDIPSEQYVDFETQVMMVPQYDTGNPSMISQGPSVCIFSKEDPQEVLASWLFTQYLLTDEVQMAYSETEGYVPVTLQARENPDYLDYLAAEGSDDSAHYDIKIKASKLLLNNTDKTFVTPVFNGSASLRDAAGQLIENVVKAARRKQNWTSQDQFDTVSSLYRLDQIGNTETESYDCDELPAESKGLLIVLGAFWAAVVVGELMKAVKKVKRRSKESQS